MIKDYRLVFYVDVSIVLQGREGDGLIPPRRNLNFIIVIDTLQIPLACPCPHRSLDPGTTKNASKMQSLFEKVFIRRYFGASVSGPFLDVGSFLEG